ncbi:MAG TPA: hypothetical protein VFX60_08830, partial [Micromonospora sp.]|nr:hypothetical protein [Micromonospora sp.]
EVSPLLPPVTRTGSAGSTPGTTAEPGTGDSGPAASESTRPETHVRPPAYRRSLILSGVLGLLISMTGIAMVSHRRRLW